MCDHHQHDPSTALGRPSAVPRASRRGFVRGAALAGGLGAWAGAAARWTSRAAAVGGPVPVTMAMHVHASFSEGEGSVGSQLQCARDAGVDVVWFTEHDWRMSHYDYRTQVSFNDRRTEDQFGQSFKWVPSVVGAPAGTSGGFVTSPDSPRDPSSTSGSLQTTVTASSSRVGDSYLWYAQDGTSRHNYHGNLTGAALSVDVLPVTVGSDGWGELRVELSNHPASGGRPAGSYVLVYRFGTTGKAAASGFTGVVPVKAPVGRWTTATLDPVADVRRLWPDLVAEDNALNGLWLGVTARSGATADVVFDDLRFSWPSPTQLSPFGVQRSILSAYAGAYSDVTAITGQEVSFLPEHMNWFGGDDYLMPYNSPSLTSTVDPAATNQRARALAARGGQLSINHPFGAGEETARTPTLADLVVRYLQYGAYAATMLEVGYAQRGGASLGDHLDLWDAMSRNGVYLTGTGVNDNHVGLGAGGIGWEDDVNRFTTSVWSTAQTQGALLAQLASGRAFTSEVTQPGLSLDLYADGVAMGAVSVRPDLASRAVTVDGRNLPGGATVTLTQGAVDYAGSNDPRATSVDVATIGTAELRSGPASRTVPTKSSSFVRATVQDGDGRTVAASNPVWLLHEKSRTAVPAARRAADSA